MVERACASSEVCAELVRVLNGKLIVIDACGRSGEHEHALALFQEMKKNGISPDRVAYNALFSALRVAERPELASDLWDEMCGRGGNSTASKASAVADRMATPDIVTLTDVIATLKKDNNRIDEVFAEAVERRIVLVETEHSLDNLWEVDLSSMSFPVARAACRYVVRKALDAVREGQEPEDLTLITGVAMSSKRGDKTKTESPTNRKGSSKRDFLQQVLQEDFSPPIKSLVPKLAQGTIQVDKAILLDWIKKQEKSG